MYEQRDVISEEQFVEKHGSQTLASMCSQLDYDLSFGRDPKACHSTNQVRAVIMNSIELFTMRYPELEQSGTLYDLMNNDPVNAAVNVVNCKRRPGMNHHQKEIISKEELFEMCRSRNLYSMRVQFDYDLSSGGDPEVYHPADQAKAVIMDSIERFQIEHPESATLEDFMNNDPANCQILLCAVVCAVNYHRIAI